MRQKILLVVKSLDDEPRFLVRIRRAFVLDVVNEARAVDAMPLSVSETSRYVYSAVNEAVDLLVAGGDVFLVILRMRDHLRKVDHELQDVDAMQLIVGNGARGLNCQCQSLRRLFYTAVILRW